MKNIEQLTLKYQANNDNVIFTEIYQIVERLFLRTQSYKLTVAKSIGATEHELQEIFDDCVLYTITTYDGSRDFKSYFKWKFRNMRANFLRNKKTRDKIEVIELDASPLNGAATSKVEIADEFDLEHYIIGKKKADQRELIDYLLEGADEVTTAIVTTFLQHPKPTATAVAKELGYHHSKVTRALTRLASKFSTKQFGSHRDYLVAL